MLPNRGLQRQREYHELLQQIRQLENEISVLSRIDAGHVSKPTEAGSFDRSLQHFRVELASSAVLTKRQELDAMKAHAAEMLARDPKVALPLPPPKPETAPEIKRPQIIAAGVVGLILVVIGIGAATGMFGGGSHVPVVTTMIAPTLEQRVEEAGALFYQGPPVAVKYEGGVVTLSGHPAPTGQWYIDDRMVMTVTREDKTTDTWEHLFNEDCEKNEVLGPLDVTNLFRPGTNLVSVALYDACGGAAGTSGPILITVH